MKNIITLLFLILMAGFTQAQNMDYEKLDKTLKIACDSVDGGNGRWQMLYRGRIMVLIADESHNRMRIISPILSRQDVKQEYMEQALLANFHSVLDAKYAMSDDILWSVYLHPLKELKEHQLKDALSQVFLAAETFGTTFQSTELVFPKAEKKESPIEPKQPKKQKL